MKGKAGVISASVATLVLVLACANPSRSESSDPGAVTAPQRTSASPSPSDGSIGDGKYEVGRDIVPGKYETKNPSESAICYWARLKDASGSFTAIIANGNVGPNAPGIMTVAQTDKFVEFTYGCRWHKTG